MKKRSTSLSCSARSRWSRYAPTMLALCARYQPRAVGSAANSIQRPIAGEDGGPPSPSRRAAISQPSRRSRSLIARHQRLPGTSASSEARTPRRICHLINESAARRNRRWRADPSVGSSYVCAHSENRAAGSSRTSSTCAAARSAALAESNTPPVSFEPARPSTHLTPIVLIPWRGAQEDGNGAEPKKTIIRRGSVCRSSVCGPRKWGL